MQFSSLIKVVMVAAPLAMTGSLMGCAEEKGPMEKMGESIDEGVEEVKDEVDDAT